MRANIGAIVGDNTEIAGRVLEAGQDHHGSGVR
jgi:hypothetical protein